MQNTALVSVIVPCYNDGKYIRECLNSIHKQHYENYEIILVDDGSTDEATLRELKKINHSKLKKYRTHNQGPSKTRNFGISESSGEYIFPLDSDNKVGKVFIQEAVEILNLQNEVKVVCCNLQYFGAKTGIKVFKAPTLENMICENQIECASVYRRKDFDMTKGYNPNMSEGLEDWDFWLSMLENGGKAHKIEKAEIYYRVKRSSRNSSISQTQFTRLRRQIYENHKELYAKHFLDPKKCFEYELLINSKEYLLGKALLKPLRKLYNFFH